MFPIPWNYPFRKKDGTVVNMEDAGGGGGGGYVLPPATESTLGGIKVGDGLSVEADGTLSASGGGGGGGIRVVRSSIISSHAAGTDVYIGGDSLANFGMQAGEKLVAVVPASGHFLHGVQCSTDSNGAGKKFSNMIPSDTVFLNADLKYQTSSSSPGEICFIFEST